MPLTLRVRCDLVAALSREGRGHSNHGRRPLHPYELTYPTSPESGAMATNTVGVLAWRNLPHSGGLRCARDARLCYPAGAFGKHGFGGGDTGEIGAVRGRVVVERARFARKEQALVYRRGKPCPAIRMAGQGMGIGAARGRIAAPAMQRERLHPAREIAAKQADELRDRELGKRGLPRRLQLGR